MTHPPIGADGALLSDFDPEAALDRDSRVLLDPKFLAVLHRELLAESNPASTARWLLRMGFLHGMQDAFRARAAGARRDAWVPPLAIRSRSVPAQGAVEVHGDWPERREAAARLDPDGDPDTGSCALSAGYTSGWLSAMLDANLIVTEQCCSTEGHAHCRFIAREAALCLESEDAIPFDAFRALVRARQARDAPLELAQPTIEDGRVDPDAACVHIWGPVMVIPFGGADEGIRALELLGHDPEAAEVSVVVVHLRGAVIDEAFGALALEQIVQTAEAWGAETLFAESSPLYDHVIGDLTHPPLLVLKDLEEAIATAFQIAHSQRRLS